MALYMLYHVQYRIDWDGVKCDGDEDGVEWSGVGWRGMRMGWSGVGWGGVG